LEKTFLWTEILLVEISALFLSKEEKYE
jgi:hypothetical protein